MELISISRSQKLHGPTRVPSLWLPLVSTSALLVVVPPGILQLLAVKSLSLLGPFRRRLYFSFLALEIQAFWGLLVLRTLINLKTVGRNLQEQVRILSCIVL